MTIQADDPLVNTYVGNGVTDTFDFHFKITAEDELNVIVVGVAFLELGTDYTVTGVGVTGGGSITLTAGPLDDGVEIRIYDWVQPSQLIPFANQGAFRGYQHENAFDKITRVAKRSLEYGTNALTLPTDSPWYISRALPAPIPGGYYRWDENGFAMEISAITGFNDIGQTYGTVAAGDDSRFGAVDYGDLDPVVNPDGTETVAADKNGDGIGLTVQQIAGSPFRALHGHLKDRYRGYSAFNRTRPGYTATNAALMDLEPYVTYFSGTGSAFVWQLMGYNFYKNLPVMALNTGSNTNGYAGFRHVQPLIFDPTQIIEQVIAVGPGTLPNTPGQNYTLQFGAMYYVAGTLATFGMYIQADPSTGNWRGVVQNAGGTSYVDTGVAVTVPTLSADSITLRMYYDPNDATPAAKFSVNNSAFVLIPNSTRVLATDQELFSAIQIVKSSGSTPASCLVSSHYWEAQSASVADYLSNYP